MKHLLLTLALAGASSAPVLADQALASDKHCMGCHAVNEKKVGPAFKDVATKYRGDKNAADRLALKIRQGGAGAWGPVTMPPNPQVNEAEAKKLATWVLGLK